MDKAAQLKQSDAFSDYFYWHGFCATLTEAFASWTHNQVKNNYSPKGKASTIETQNTHSGRRLSFGYPALPVIAEQRQVLRLLHANLCGITMTQSGMLDPEYSTCALVLLDKRF